MKNLIATLVATTILSASAFASSGHRVIGDQENGPKNPSCIAFVQSDDGIDSNPLSGVVYGFSVNDPGAFAAYTSMKDSEYNSTPFYFLTGNPGIAGLHPGDCSVGVIYTYRQHN